MRCLLYVNPVGRVAVGDLDTGFRFAFDDLPTGGEQRADTRAAAVAWSAAGQWTAWSVQTSELGEPHEIRIHHEGSDSNHVVTPTDAFYLSPSPCGRILSHLSPGPLGLELGTSDVHRPSLRIVERGQPLFWSWSPDAAQLAVHAGDHVEVVPVDGGEARVLTEDAGMFIVPWWLPDGSIVLAGPTHVESHDPDGTVTALAAHPGAARFAVDPDGRRLALVESGEDGRPRLVVIDLLTGERAIALADRPLAFFWLPDGRHLAALGPAGPGRVRWHVTGGDDVRILASFRPGVAWTRTVLPFFEQYAHSHAVWSADGRSLVAPSVYGDGHTDALVQTIDDPDADQRFGQAVLAWWAD